MSTQMAVPTITKGRSCGSSSRSPSNSEHPQIQPPRRRAGEEEKKKMKEKNAKQWKDFNTLIDKQRACSKSVTLMVFEHVRLFV
jgi:hypothetical protein